MGACRKAALLRSSAHNPGPARKKGSPAAARAAGGPYQCRSIRQQQLQHPLVGSKRAATAGSSFPAGQCRTHVPLFSSCTPGCRWCGAVAPHHSAWSTPTMRAAAGIDLLVSSKYPGALRCCANLIRTVSTVLVRTLVLEACQRHGAHTPPRTVVPKCDKHESACCDTAPPRRRSMAAHGCPSNFRQE